MDQANKVITLDTGTGFLPRAEVFSGLYIYEIPPVEKTTRLSPKTIIRHRLTL